MTRFKKYILMLMKDEHGGVCGAIVKGVLRIVSWGYLAVVKIIDKAYKNGIKRKYKARVPVVSVGNLTLGGTGKTPFAVFLADFFLSRGKKPAVLTRGYGRDESVMLKNEMPLVSVYVGGDRVLSARRAVEDGRDLLILDDGFSHRRIERDLNILMIDGVNFFGNRAVFPRGVLREPVSAIERADMFVLTKVDSASRARIEEIRSFLEKNALGKPVVRARHKPSCLTDVTGAAYSLSSLKGKRISVVSGIGDPDYFAFLLREEGAKIVSRHDYIDHHEYTQRDVDEIYLASVSKKTENVIMTAKDYVKIKKLDLSRMEEKIFILNITIDVTSGKEILVDRLNRIITG
ncbi:MAG: tetraacyldisaccharide 4'-kinase [Candidatus Omnitrophica bacterium]|nr:tetraacyldisaccharide 4'-kinase [Candidatus Omnitrophota bacterium]